jgi:hypothetical protein
MSYTASPAPSTKTTKRTGGKTAIQARQAKINSRIRRAVERLRIKDAISKAETARRMLIHEVHYCRLASGAQAYTFPSIIKAAEAFGLKVGELLRLAKV